jgi:hypothetical protein
MFIELGYAEKRSIELALSKTALIIKTVSEYPEWSKKVYGTTDMLRVTRGLSGAVCSVDEDIRVFLYEKTGSLVQIEVFINPKCNNKIEKMSKILDDIMSIYHRVETYITAEAGHSVRRYLSSLGFVQEGALRGNLSRIDEKTGKVYFIDSKLWAKVATEEAHGAGPVH